MPVITRKRSGDFALIPNSVADDNTISFDARGLLCYLLAKPNDWNVQVSNIQKAGGIGRDKTYKLLKALKDAGYIEVRTKRDKKTGKIIDHSYVVYDCAVPTRLPLPEFQEVANSPDAKSAETEQLPDFQEVDTPLTDLPESGESGRNNNKKITKTHSPKPPELAPDPETLFDEIWEMLAKKHQPKSRASALSQFRDLGLEDQLAARNFFKCYQLRQFWQSQQPKLITYLKTKAWKPFQEDPPKDADGYFVIKPFRPEWEPWLEHLKKTEGVEAVEKTRRVGSGLFKRRWPTDPKQPGV